MTKGSGQAMDLDGFLGHSTRGPAVAWLDGWIKREPPLVRIVLHTKAPIMAVWQHPWPRVRTLERDGKEVREVWGGQFNSWETEDVLKAQYRREQDGTRSVPPQICPMSLMLEQVYQAFRNGDVAWDAPLFRFVGDDPTKAVTLHVAPMLNLINKLWKDLKPAEKQAAIKAGVPSPKEAWKSAMLAKCNYIFTAVDYDHPEEGVQIARQTTLVGDKMKSAIRDKIKADGQDKGHPFLNPYVFQWEYNPNEEEFGKKYHVLALGQKFPITSAIRELIVDKDPPDISRLIAKGNVQDLRTSMEAYYVGPDGLLDFDYIFGAAEKLLGMETEDEAEDDTDALDIADEIVGEVDVDEEAEPEAAVEPEPAKAPAKAAAKATAPAQAKAAPAQPAAQAAQAAQAETPKAGRRVRRAVEDARYVVADRRPDETGEERAYAADGMELLACDECETLMRADETKCRNCGAEYDVEPAAAQPAAAPPKQPAKAAPATKPAGAKPGANAAPGKAQSTAQAAGKDRLGF